MVYAGDPPMRKLSEAMMAPLDMPCAEINNTPDVMVRKPFIDLRTLVLHGTGGRREKMVHEDGIEPPTNPV